MSPTPLINAGETVIAAGPVCSSMASSSACGTLVLSCIVPVLLVASSIPAMMVKRNMEFNSYIRRQHARTYGHVNKISALSGSLPIGLKKSGTMHSNGLLGDESRGSAFRLPLHPTPQEPMLTLSLSDTSVLHLGFSSFREGLMSQLMDGTHDKEMASRSSPTLGVVPMLTQWHSPGPGQEALPVRGLTMIQGASDAMIEPEHSPTMLEDSFGSDDATGFMENSNVEETYYTVHPHQASAKDINPTSAPNLADFEKAAQLSEEALVILLSPLGLSDSQMIGSEDGIQATVSPAYKSVTSLAVLDSGAQSVNSCMVDLPLVRDSPLLHDGPLSHQSTNKSAAGVSSTSRLSDPGELWDEDDESNLSFGASVSGADGRIILGSIAESLLLRDTGDLWDSDDEQLFSNVERLATLSTYASLGITSLEFEIEDVAPPPQIQASTISTDAVTQRNTPTDGLNTCVQSMTALAVSTASFPQIHSPSLASDDGFYMFEKGDNCDLDEPIMNELLPQTSLGALASQSSSLWTAAQSSSQVSGSTLVKTSTYAESSPPDSMSLASIVDTHIVDYATVIEADTHIAISSVICNAQEPQLQNVKSHSSKELSDSNHDDNQVSGRVERFSLCMDVEQDQSFNSTISPVGFFGQVLDAAMAVDGTSKVFVGVGNVESDAFPPLKPRGYVAGDRVSVLRREELGWW